MRSSSQRPRRERSHSVYRYSLPPKPKIGYALRCDTVLSKNLVWSHSRHYPFSSEYIHSRLGTIHDSVLTPTFVLSASHLLVMAPIKSDFRCGATRSADSENPLGVWKTRRRAVSILTQSNQEAKPSECSAGTVDCRGDGRPKETVQGSGFRAWVDCRGGCRPKERVKILGFRF